MIVRKKRNNGSPKTVYIDDSSSMLASTNIPILNNITSMQLAINGLLNASITFLNENKNVLTNVTEQMSFTASASTQETLKNTELNEINRNETLQRDTILIGTEHFPENLIWGIDNTVGCIIKINFFYIC